MNVTTLEEFARALHTPYDYVSPVSTDSSKDGLYSLEEVQEQLPIIPVKLAADKLLVAAFSGISPLLAREMVYRSEGTEPADDPAAWLWPAYQKMMGAFVNHQYNAQIIIAETTNKASFSVTALTHLKGMTQEYENISLCLEAFYGDKADRDTVKQRVSDLIRFLQNERNKHEKSSKNCKIRFTRQRMLINSAFKVNY